MVARVAETWFFDRLGENLDVPPLHLGDLDKTVQALQRHALEHIIVAGGFHLTGPNIRRRSLGGYDVVDAKTGYTYGQARKAPVFAEKPFPVLPPPLMPPRGRAALAGRRHG